MEEHHNFSLSTSGSTALQTLYRQESWSYHRRGEGYIVHVGYRVHASSSQVSSDGRGGRISSSGGAIFEYQYNKKTCVATFLSFDRRIPYLDEGFWFDVDIFKGGAAVSSWWQQNKR